MIKHILDQFTSEFEDDSSTYDDKKLAEKLVLKQCLFRILTMPTTDIFRSKTNRELNCEGCLTDGSVKDVKEEVVC